MWLMIGSDRIYRPGYDIDGTYTHTPAPINENMDWLCYVYDALPLCSFCQWLLVKSLSHTTSASSCALFRKSPKISQQVDITTERNVLPLRLQDIQTAIIGYNNKKKVFFLFSRVSSKPTINSTARFNIKRMWESTTKL